MKAIENDFLLIEWDDYWTDMIPVKKFASDVPNGKKINHGFAEVNGTLNCKITVKGKKVVLDYLQHLEKYGVVPMVVTIFFSDNKRTKISKIYWQEEHNDKRRTDVRAKWHCSNPIAAAAEGKRYQTEVNLIKRKPKLAFQRKQEDGYTCQVCNYYLAVEDATDKCVADAHHWRELSKGGKRVNTSSDLVTLCPNCHRLAHLIDRKHEPNPKSDKDEIRIIKKHWKRLMRKKK